MKIEKKIKYQNKVLKLKLLKTKIYEKNHHLKSITIEDIEYRLKKALHIIYKYHLNDKKILFVGSELKTSNKIKLLIKNTKHALIPKIAWMNGIITNPSSSFKYLDKNKKTVNSKLSEILFQIKKKSDLIVILDSSPNINALNESYSAKIPTIFLNSNLNILDNKTSYKIPGTFKFTDKKIRNNLFYSILANTLQKANKIKFSKNRYKSHKMKQIFNRKHRKTTNDFKKKT
uniref:Ribosomal protein S2 n=1 Tax=Berkeleya fennica TaxID=1577906 RepID=A0A0U1XYD2_BERFE|nr:ribosomal protein S2 [Berkeleya fennica]AJA05807.1 ribosomal protein S2 [Berkeleya fennica]